MAIETTEQTITYTVSVTVTRHVRRGNYDESLEEVAEWMRGREAQHEMEREILRALKKLDGDCDCEVMEVR